MSSNHLHLQEQLCFPIYASSRMVTRLYQPYLDEINLTYPQYITMLSLWEKDRVKVSDLGKELFLYTNTLTPLLKKLEAKGLIKRVRSKKDERTVLISLTNSGMELRRSAEDIPIKLVENLGMSIDELKQMRKLMWKLLSNLDK
ncbi:MAG: MarR family transcriptional regulator [Crocinitomicaceae bacterium]|nr:MarR family transcriptional regulator [Crocinitomicaceae bacterium]